jgi:hypothetical protein
MSRMTPKRKSSAMDIPSLYRILDQMWKPCHCEWGERLTTSKLDNLENYGASSDHQISVVMVINCTYENDQKRFLQLYLQISP